MQPNWSRLRSFTLYLLGNRYAFLSMKIDPERLQIIREEGLEADNVRL
jgi:hypothetical protein